MDSLGFETVISNQNFYFRLKTEKLKYILGSLTSRVNCSIVTRHIEYYIYGYGHELRARIEIVERDLRP